MTEHRLPTPDQTERAALARSSGPGPAAMPGIDSAGLSESLCFFDAQGRGCCRLQRLPESDFHAWERLAMTLPVTAEASARSKLRWATRSAIPVRRACALRLHALPGRRGGARLAAADVSLSPLGQASARRLAGVALKAGPTLPTEASRRSIPDRTPTIAG